MPGPDLLPEAQGPPSSPAPLPAPRAALSLAGCLSSRLGDEVSVPAILLFALAVTGSPGQGALAYAGLTGGAALAGPFVGLSLDRVRRPGRLLALCLVAYGSGLVTMVGLAGRGPWPLVVLLAVVTGAFGPALAGGWSAQLPTVVADPRRAATLDVTSYNIAGLAGPALAALAASGGRPAVAVGVAAALVVLAVPGALLLPGRPVEQPTADAAAPGRYRSLLSDLRLGFAVLVRVPTLRGATVGSSLSFLTVGMFLVACPVLGADRLGGADRGAWLISVLAATSLLAVVVGSRWRARGTADQVLLLSMPVAAAGLFLLALVHDPVPTFLAAALLGIADGPQLLAVFAIRHRETPPRSLSQVFTTAASLKIGCAAVGGAVAAPLLHSSPQLLLLVAAAVQLAAMGCAIAAGTPVRSPRPGRGIGRSSDG